MLVLNLASSDINLEAARIHAEGTQIANHSGKVTGCTTLFNANFADNVVKSRSGHHSDAAQLYKGPLKQMRKTISVDHRGNGPLHLLHVQNQLLLHRAEIWAGSHQYHH